MFSWIIGSSLKFRFLLGSILAIVVAGSRSQGASPH